ncbi:hypothetical protein [Streptomyces sp. NPDC047928]|uniref:hypothetical protein n=1 Tax=unclassified Streptomyces TaxID=2593676 RepID=UPI003721C749
MTAFAAVFMAPLIRLLTAHVVTRLLMALFTAHAVTLLLDVVPSDVWSVVPIVIGHPSIIHRTVHRWL